MDDQQARELLARERTRILEEARALGLETSDDLSTTDLADSASDLYQQEFDESRLEQLREQLAALERAEQRLADGQYGRSVESGEPIPDARLEAVPTAERTITEQERYDAGH